MELLRTLTLIYAGVLVLALAASLVTILVYLRRIAGVLRETAVALGTVADESAPLEAHLKTLCTASTTSAGDLSRAREQLDRAEERLSSLRQPAGVRGASRQEAGS